MNRRNDRPGARKMLEKTEIFVRIEVVCLLNGRKTQKENLYSQTARVASEVDEIVSVFEDITIVEDCSEPFVCRRVKKLAELLDIQ